MSIEELMCVVPPPKRVHEPGDEEKWKLFQERMGMEFPRDFYDFGMRYGTGTIQAFDLEVLNPFSSKCFQQVAANLDWLAEFRRYGMEPCPIWSEEPYPVYPNHPGLFMLGSDANGYRLHWFADGRPDEWTVVLVTEENEVGEYGMSLTTFLAKAISHDIQEPLRYSSTSKEPHVFWNELGQGSTQHYFNPTWLTWKDGTAANLARSIHDDRAFDRMPILADALEEAGCDNMEILNHCRHDKVHLRGCWVLDSLLRDKEEN